MRNVLIVAKKEYMCRLKSPAFIWSTILLIALILAMIFFGAKATGESFENNELANAFISESVKANISAQTQASQEVLEKHGLSYSEIQQEIAKRQSQILDEAKAASADSGCDTTKYYIGMLVAILIFVSITLTGNVVAQGVVEEKGGRVVEILLGTMSSFKLLLGKILGIGALGITQILLLVAISLRAITLISGGAGGGSDLFAGVDIWSFAIILVAYYIVGYFCYIGLYAAFAATVSRPEEVNQAISPVMIVLMVPYIISLVPGLLSSSIQRILEYIPLLSPILMPSAFVRGDTDLLHALISLAISVAFLPFIMLIAAKIYNYSILQTGSRVKVLQIFNKHAFKGTK